MASTMDMELNCDTEKLTLYGIDRWILGDLANLMTIAWLIEASQQDTCCYMDICVATGRTEDLVPVLT